MSLKPLSLKELAERLGLSPATVSLVINNSRVADSIPQETKDRIFAAARKYKYRPNFFARSLRAQRSFTVGVMVPEVSDGYSASVMSGIEDFLLQEGYFYFVVSHRHRADLIDEYPRLFLERSVDGLIAVDTPWSLSLKIPVVTVSGHNQVKGVTNVVLDHVQAAEVAIEHLVQLGHRQIAFIKGQVFSSDTEVRWSNIERAAGQFGIPIGRSLVAQLEGDSASPDLGYEAAERLLKSRKPFTALFAFNDISAMGAIQALREAKLRVPEDVSVVGFDDIQSAAYQNPALTTVRQPLREMGSIAAETLLRRIRRPEGEGCNNGEITIQPKLIVRGTTCRAKNPIPSKRATVFSN
ncbi:MAG TPA: LacI family DNA-binding transcriptional regulator [Candidatus Sulfotelmatobacter sp.]|nr:LacI family DNA-binding transcriptional regulator [Candidatus Sulfotelmatobacter sp.]